MTVLHWVFIYNFYEFATFSLEDIGLVKSSSDILASRQQNCALSELCRTIYIYLFRVHNLPYATLINRVNIKKRDTFPFLL